MVLLIIYCGFVGLCVGSFLNVVVYRVPRHLSIIRPRSSCPGCGAFIENRDNIPVVAWLLLRGRCRNCREPISVRYPLVEAGGGALFALTAWRIGAHWALPAYLVLCASLLALALIDLEHLLLPRTIVYPTLATVGGWLTLTAALTHQWHPWLMGLYCSLGWGGLFFLLNLASPRSLGFGDVRLGYVLGAALGYLGVGSALLGFFVSNLIGAVVGIGLLLTKRASRGQAVPYGVFLAAGTLVTLFLGRPLLALLPPLRFH